jgi:hypothetical protein
MNVSREVNMYLTSQCSVQTGVLQKVRPLYRFYYGVETSKHVSSNMDRTFADHPSYGDGM